MNNIFCVTGEGHLGCTFLEWSIHWLMGYNTYYNYKFGEIPLVANPLTKSNAHEHRKNHPYGFENTKNALDILANLPTTQWKSIYPFKKYLDVIASEEGIELNNKLSEDTYKILETKSINDFDYLWNYLNDNNVPRIYVFLDKNCYWYLSYKRVLERKFLSTDPYESEEDAINDFFNIFFSDSMTEYETKLDNIWDKREFWALNIREPSPHISPDLTQPHKSINAQSLWHDGETTLINIFKYLGEQINQQRLEEWIPIYRDWQALQLNSLSFIYDLNHIIDSIVNNYDHSLERYNLTLHQEAIIQHLLIYKHNLTLKNWNLEKFPNNTKDLHLLLEENFHPVKKIY